MVGLFGEVAGYARVEEEQAGEVDESKQVV